MKARKNIKAKYSYKDLDNPNYDPVYDQDAKDNLHKWVIRNMEEEFD